MARLGASVQLTADAGGFKKSIDDVSAALIRTQQQSLRAAQETRDAFGVLRDSQGRIVEGLAKWQKNLGYYVDELGRVRTANDRFVEGLTTLQRKIGLEVDEAGQIFNAAGEVVGELGNSASRAEAPLGSIDEQLKKIQRDALTAANGFGRLKAGLDVILGNGNALSKVVDSIGKLSQSATAFGQIKDQLILVKNQLGDLSKLARGMKQGNSLGSLLGKAGSGGSGGASSLISSLGKATKLVAGLKAGLAALTVGAAATAAAFVALGVAVAVLYKNDKKKEWRALNSIDPALKGLDEYREKFNALAEAADIAGDKIKSVGDALKYGALKPERENGLTDVAVLVDALRQNEETGLSASQRALATAGTGVFGKTQLGQAVDTKTLQFMDFFNWRGGADKNSKEEREEIYAALNEYVAALKEETKEEETEAQRLARQISDLEAIITTVPEGDERRQELESILAKLKERENAAAEADAASARAEALAASGVDKFLQAQDSAAVSIGNYKAKLDEWQELVDGGMLTTEEFSQAAQAAGEALKNELLGRLGVKLPEALDGTLAAFQELQEALDAGVLSADEYNESVRQLQEQNAATLAASAGLSLDVPTAPQSLEEFQAKLDEELAGRKINSEQYAALLKAYQENAAKVLQAEQDAAASALAAAQGLDLDAVEKARRSEQTFEEQLEEWRGAAREGRVSADALAKAESALALAIDEREEAARKEAEEAAKKARDDAMKDSGLDSLRAQAEELERATRTWRDDLEETMEKARAAFEAGTISASDLEQAEKDYAAVLEAKSKEERENARQDARSALGVDSLMESLKSPAQKLSETLGKLQDALIENYISSDEYDALRSKAVEEYRAAVDDFKEKSDEAVAKTERAVAGYSLSDSRDFYKAFVNQMAPRSYEKRIEDSTARIAKTQDDALRAQYESVALLEQIARAPQFEVFG